MQRRRICRFQCFVFSLILEARKINEFIFRITFMPSIRENVKLHLGFSGPPFCHFIYERRPFSCRKKSFNNCKPQNASVDMDVLTNFFDDCKLACWIWVIRSLHRTKGRGFHILRTWCVRCFVRKQHHWWWDKLEYTHIVRRSSLKAIIMPQN